MEKYQIFFKNVPIFHHFDTLMDINVVPEVWFLWFGQG